MHVNVDRLGRVVVPKSVRKALGVESGGVLDLEEGAGCVTLRPLPQEPPLAVREGVLVYRGRLEGNPEVTLRQLRAGRVRDLGGRR